jgi:uncharacterized membrane-anchored protein
VVSVAFLLEFWRTLVVVCIGVGVVHKKARPYCSRSNRSFSEGSRLT